MFFEDESTRGFYCDDSRVAEGMLLLSGRVCEVGQPDPETSHDLLGININRIAFFTGEPMP